MNKINIIDENLDGIWDRYFDGSNSFRLSGVKGGVLPYWKNIPGWRNWFKQHIDDDITFWYPDKISYVVMEISCLMKKKFSVGLTGYVRNVDKLVKCDRFISQYICAAKFIGMQLIVAGVKPGKIRYRCPDEQLSQINEEIDSLGFRVDGGPLIIALSRASDRDGIEKLIWACAIVQHIDSRSRVVIVGEINDEQRERIMRQVQTQAKEDLVIFHENEEDWDSIVSMGDVVVSSVGELDDVMRMKHCLAAGQNFVAASKLCREFIIGKDNVKEIKAMRERYVAAAITEFCGI
ncbi:MAG: hypothetical protein JEZ07_01890 [Phycisphaerae bacterium]|nr:hypothetical protein [Phycisphaerae bacterium]